VLRAVCLSKSVARRRLARPSTISAAVIPNGTHIPWPSYTSYLSPFGIVGRATLPDSFGSTIAPPLVAQSFETDLVVIAANAPGAPNSRRFASRLAEFQSAQINAQCARPALQPIEEKEMTEPCKGSR
jgi:hypothetical protein